MLDINYIKQMNIDCVNEYSHTRKKVFAAEAFMKQMPQLELKHFDHFSYGLYARELKIPKGCILVGKLHKYPQLNILAEGEIEVLVDGQVKYLKAPYVISSPAGTKRMARALEDTTWITIHATEETDVDKIEHEFIAQTEQEYIEFCNKQLMLPLPLED